MAMSLPELLPYSEMEPPRELTFENIWAAFGEYTDFTKPDYKDFWDETVPLNQCKPHHNFHHAKEVLWNAMGIVAWFIKEGVPIRRRVMATTPLMHDVDKDKEISAVLYIEVARHHGLDKDEIKCGSDAIIATALKGKMKTIEDVALVCSDMGNVGRDYENTFRVTMGLVMAEEELDSTLEHPFKKDMFDDNTVKVLATYFCRKLVIGSFTAEWLEHAKENIWRFAEEVAMSRGLQTVDYLKKLGGSPVKLFSLPSDSEASDY
jgi:hypothetical protein